MGQRTQSAHRSSLGGRKFGSRRRPRQGAGGAVPRCDRRAYHTERTGPAKSDRYDSDRLRPGLGSRRQRARGQHRASRGQHHGLHQLRGVDGRQMAGDAARNGPRHRASRNPLQSRYRLLRRSLLSGPIRGCCVRARRNCAHIPCEKCPRARGHDRRVGRRGGRSSDRDAGQFQYRSSRPDYRTDGATPYTEHFSLSFCRERREPDVVRYRLCGSVSTHRRLRRPYSQGHETGRASGAGAHQVRAGHQSAHSQNARPHRFPNPACARRRGDRVKRRQFIMLLGGAAAAWPVATYAQQPAMPVIGFLHPASPDTYADRLRAFRKGLKDVGFVEGENAEIEFRWAENQFDRLATLAAELVRRPVAVIVTSGGTPPALAAKAATATIPIVFAVPEDPVRLGLVASLAKPGGNATGVNFFSDELVAKRLELLRELVPGATRVAVLLNPASAGTMLRDVETAAGAMGLQIKVINASTSRDIDIAFATLGRERPDALFVTGGPFLLSRRMQLALLAARHAIPTSYGSREYAEIGGLMTYGASLTDVLRQVGVYAGRIREGAKPSDLPVMQSTKLELVINLAAARALNLEVPPTLLARADEVIE